MKENQESDDCMSTDMEAANTVRRLQLHCLAARASLQMAVHEALMPATAARPQEEEYHYDSDDSVLNLDEEYPGLAEQVMQWWAACQSATCTPPWQPSDFSRPEQSHFNKLPDLRELLNQAEEAKHANGCLYNQLPRCRCPSPALGIWTANVSNVTIK